MCRARNQVVIADDTDILILLIHHAGHVSHKIWFQPNIKRESKKAPRCWNIGATRQHLGSTVCNHIIFAHAVPGCDTTSRVFFIGKRKAVSKLKSNSFFVRQTVVFKSCKSKPEEVIKAGEHGPCLLI